MTKVELSGATGFSRPTIDKILESDSAKRDMLYFIESFTLFGYTDRLKRIKESKSGQTSKVQLDSYPRNL